MNLSDYQERTKETAVYPREHGIVYLALGLASEAGEVASVVKRAIRAGTDLSAERLSDEIGDTLWYLAALAEAAGLSLEDIALANVAKLRERKARGTLATAETRE